MTRMAKRGNLWLDHLSRAKSSCLWEQDVETLEYKYDWFPTDKKMRGSYLSYLVSQQWITTYYPDLPQWFVALLHNMLGPATHGAALQSHRCRVSDGKGGEFRIRRLGPFVGNGGFDWHKMKLEDPYNLRGQIRGDIHMTGFMVAPVAEDGEILGNPPIHVHHANLGPNFGTSSLSRISQWHGDSQCSDSDGGTACYITTLPYGFAFPVSQELRLDVDFNDVRPLNSPELRFWLETAISVVEPPQEEQLQDVGTVIIGVPFRMHWWKSSDLQRLYFVPPDQPSALWTTARMPTAGTFVKGKLETHQHMLDIAWVFSGISPEELGLNSEAWHLENPWSPWMPKQNGWSDGSMAMDALKGHVQTHFQKTVQRCADASCKSLPALVWTLNQTVFEDGEEREMAWPETVWSFQKDEQFTIVIFHKALAMPHHDQVELPQHLAITGHYLPKAGTPANYFFVLPSTKADNAWIDSIQWFGTLTQFGGPFEASSSWWTASLVVLLLVSTIACCGILNTIARQIWESKCGPCNRINKRLCGEAGPKQHRSLKYAAVCSEDVTERGEDDSMGERETISPQSWGNCSSVEELPHI